MKPTFKVLCENFYKNGIEFVNWFEFGQWSDIKKELTELKKKLSKFKKDDFKQIQLQERIKKFFEKNAWSVEYEKWPRCESLDELIEYALEERLDRMCMYYFWSKCEYEVIVSAWPPREGSEEKIDIYDQLRANWDIFKELVFRELKLR